MWKDMCMLMSMEARNTEFPGTRVANGYESLIVHMGSRTQVF